MVEHGLGHLAPISAIDRVHVVTNAKFATPFQTWSDHYRATQSKLFFIRRRMGWLLKQFFPGACQIPRPL